MPGRSRGGTLNRYEITIMVHVFIVEDHLMIRQGYVLILGREPDITICGEAGSAEEALDQIPRVAPDIVVIDFSLPGKNGLELVRQLQKEQPTLPTIMISGHNEITFITEVLAAGAKRYIVKDHAPQFLVSTIREVVAT
jgi:DNA-binding NarL/FixJ family response regulator